MQKKSLEPKYPIGPGITEWLDEKGLPVVSSHDTVLPGLLIMVPYENSEKLSPSQMVEQGQIVIAKT